MTLTEADVAVFTAAPIIADTRDLTRAEWLQLRRAGLGGSDAAAVLGIAKYSSTIEVWRQKVGLSEGSDASTLAMRRGQHAEAFILHETAAADPELHIDVAPFMVHHPDHPELTANLDGLAAHDRRRGRGVFEAKNVTGWAVKDWADGPPAHYEAQVFHYLAVLGLDWAIVAADIGDPDEIPTYLIERDDAFIDLLVAKELAWWERHVVDGIEPTADGSAATTDLLKLIEARHGTVRQLDPGETAEIKDLYLQLAHDKAVVEDATAGVDTAKNRVRQLMGEATELIDDDGRTWATWRQAKPKTVIDHEAALVAAAEQLGVPVVDLLTPHTTTRPGARALRTAPGLTHVTTKENAA